MDVHDAPLLAGIHHLKLPVTDLARSREWYHSRLGYQVQMEFIEQGTLMGYGLAHPNGGPMLGLRLNSERARAAAGFDYFAIGVPGKEAIDQLAARLTALGEQHAGVHWASIGWILPPCTIPTVTRSASTPTSTTPSLTPMRSPPSTTRGKAPNAATRLPPTPRYLVRMALAKRRARAAAAAKRDGQSEGWQRNGETHDYAAHRA